MVGGTGRAGADPGAVEEVHAQIESVTFGQGFLVVEGWTANSDGSAVTQPLSLNIDGVRHTLNGLFPRADLGRSGVSDAPSAFCLDIAQSIVGDRAQSMSVEVDGVPIETIKLSSLPYRSFRPGGSLDIVSSDRVTGWIFDPGLWHIAGDNEGATITIGQYRMPIKLTVRRHELPFSSAKAGRPLGFQFNLVEALEAQFGAAAVDELRKTVSQRITLESRGQVIAAAPVVLDKQPPLPVSPPPRDDAVQSAPAAAAPAPRSAAASREPDGFIDFFAYSENLSGWLFAGWIRQAALDRDVIASKRVRIDQRSRASAEFITYTRPDVESLGLGLLGFAAAPAATLAFDLLEIEGRPSAKLHNSAALGAIEELGAVEAMRGILRTVTGSAFTPLGKILAKPIYQGVDTVNQLAVPVHLEIDEMILAPGRGAMLVGWFVDPTSAVRAIRLRSPGQPAESLMERWMPVARPDIRDAFAASLALRGEEWGFHAFAPMINLDQKRCYLEVELHDGTIAFKPLQGSSRSGRDAIVRAVSGITLTAENVKHACAELLGPTVAAINQQQVATRQISSEFVAGDPPVKPRCSIIIPLYGRLDFLNYQMALFSEHDEGLDEYIFVLDQPERREEFLHLARSVYRRYGVPLRLVLPPQNLGFAGASNEGLEAARGEFICFLNSDVMPKTPDWIARLIAAKQAAPKLGLLGARLLFEDNTVQHIGMDLERKEEFGNMLFPFHPHKGRLPMAGPGVRVVPLVTGALMMMRRELALECGGFDTDYVIGDFEDADLCMKVRARGHDCAVHDGVELFHLERQSQGSSANSWRQNLTLLNAWTYNQRWDKGLPEQVKSSGPTQIG